MQQNRSLRQELRSNRKSLTPTYRKQAILAATKNLKNLPRFKKSRRTACYMASDGEISPHLLVSIIWKHKKLCYLPALDPIKAKCLRFLNYDPLSQLCINRYGIAEPRMPIKNYIHPWALDLVITPLVGFDCHGHRIGMGGGYYDRTFSFIRARHAWRKPYIVGFAFDIQEVPNIKTNKWDIPMDAIITETRVLQITR